MVEPSDVLLGCGLYNIPLTVSLCPTIIVDLEGQNVISFKKKCISILLPLISTSLQPLVRITFPLYIAFRILHRKEKELQDVHYAVNRTIRSWPDMPRIIWIQQTPKRRYHLQWIFVWPDTATIYRSLQWTVQPFQATGQNPPTYNHFEWLHQTRSHSLRS